MNQRFGAGKVFLCLVLALHVLSGCSALKSITRKKEKKLPRMLVLPFACNCENGEIGEKMTEGFIGKLDKGTQVFDAPEFELLLSSISRLNHQRKMSRAADELPPADSQKESLPPPDPEPERVEPLISFSTSTFFRDVSLNEFFRTKVRLETGLA